MKYHKIGISWCGREIIITLPKGDEKYGAAIQAALNMTVMMDQVILIGTLSELPTDRARLRVMNFVSDWVTEQDTE